jgi:Chain length determinant protein
VDIKDYLYAIRRRLWLPIALPLVAALVTAGFIYIQPEKYQATATVIVPALSAKGYSTSAVTQYVSTFKDVLISAPVVDQISKQTHERKSDLVSGLSASTATASSNIIQVSYTGPTKTTVTDVAYWAAVDSLDALLGPQVAGATVATINSQRALDLAVQNLNAFTQQTRLLFPDVDYKVQSQELSQLEVDLTRAQVAGDPKQAKYLTKEISNRQAALVVLASKVIDFQRLQDARMAAQAVNDKAQVDLNNVNAALISDHDPSAVTVRFAGHVSRIPEILRFAGVAAGVALLLSIGYIVFMEFMHPAVPAAASGWPVAVFPRLRTRSRVPAGVVTRPPAVTKAAGGPEPPKTEAAGRSNGEL